MPAKSNPYSRLALRVTTLLFPPYALVLLWSSPASLGRKLLGSVGILLFCLPYAALFVFLLVRFGGLQIEWRGGYIPALTWQPTAPDFDELERSRAQQAAPSSAKLSLAAGTGYWTGFRGPQRDGHYQEQPILTNWPASGLRELWRQPCGGGYASFAIAQGLAFTIEQRRQQEVVVAYHVETGHEVWTHGWDAHFTESMGGDGPRATPAYDAGKLYAVGATGELRCLNADDGELLWAKNILTENNSSVPIYGVSASPLIVDEKLLVLTGGERPGEVVCYDKQDGRKLWSSARENTGYASPMVIELAGERQLLVSLATNTVGLRLDDGAVRWRFPWQVQNNQLPIAQPVIIASNRFVLSAGYFTGSAAFEVSETAGEFGVQELWRNKHMKNKFSTSVAWDGFVYGLDENILVCLDARTGERRWKDGRYGHGQLLLASGHLVILSGDGHLALVRATPGRHEEIARFPAIRGKTWNHPAISQGRLLVRNGAEMACFDLTAGADGNRQASVH
ncbi:MAG: PQQ-like beta-propeller repeat protein [Verrucomicrobiae bacterium]|nr:PQQ-like beta-propeller repeat protein [Verrucomicrobiae bacterium]